MYPRRLLRIDPGRSYREGVAVPRPTKIVSAKEKANLRPNPKGRPKKTRRRSEMEEFSKRVIDDPLYRRELYRRAREGTLQPGVEALLLQMRFGKPTDKVEVNNAPQDVRIVHEYLEEKKKSETEKK